MASSSVKFKKQLLRSGARRKSRNLHWIARPSLLLALHQHEGTQRTQRRRRTRALSTVLDFATALNALCLGVLGVESTPPVSGVRDSRNNIDRWSYSAT